MPFLLLPLRTRNSYRQGGRMIVPMTLANMRENGVRTLAVYCERCHHDAVLDVSPYPDDVPVPAIALR